MKNQLSILSQTATRQNPMVVADRGREGSVEALMTRTLSHAPTLARVGSLDEVESKTSPRSHVGFWETLPPVAGPVSELTKEHKEGAAAFALSLEQVVQSCSRISGLDGEALLAEFLKLEVEDPNNSVETHHQLYESLSTLRQNAIDEALSRSERAEELKKEADDYASTFGPIANALHIVGAAVAIGGAIFTGGATLALLSCVSALTQVAGAGIHLNTQTKTADASMMDVLASRMRQFSELHQAQISEEFEIINMIMESKNKAIANVMRMLNENMGVSMKLISVGQSR